MSMRDNDFEPYEVFDEEFGRRLARVDANVLLEWPKLRDDSNYNVLQNLKVAILDCPGIHEIIELLDIYTTCLDYMHRYPRKGDKAHRASVKRVLKKDLNEIAPCLWFQQFKTIYPFGGYPLADDLLLSTSKYLFALFNLNDLSFREEVDVDLWLREIPTHVITVAAHCFFFACGNDVRRHTYKTLQVILDMDGIDLSFGHYFQEKIGLGPELSLQQFQLLLDRQGIADDCLLHLLKDITTIVPSRISLPTLWQRSLSKSLSVLKRECCSRDMDYEDTLLSIKVPNRILEGYFASNLAPSHLSILTYVIMQHDGMKAMASGAILFAKTHNYFRMNDSVPDPRKFYEENRHLQHHLDEIFLIPIILKELSGIKRSWTIAEHEFVSLLAAKGKSLWRDTLDNLRALCHEDLPEFHMLPVALLAWHRLGTLIGIHRVLEPIVGCCYASCPEFAKPFDWPLGRCSGCRQVQYCGNECQNNDWAVHKQYCSSTKGSE